MWVAWVGAGEATGGGRARGRARLVLTSSWRGSAEGGVLCGMVGGRRENIFGVRKLRFEGDGPHGGSSVGRLAPDCVETRRLRAQTVDRGGDGGGLQENRHGHSTAAPHVGRYFFGGWEGASELQQGTAQERVGDDPLTGSPPEIQRAVVSGRICQGTATEKCRSASREPQNACVAHDARVPKKIHLLSHLFRTSLHAFRRVALAHPHTWFKVTSCA